MTSMVRSCLMFWVESYRSDICCFRAVTVLPLHLFANYPVFTMCNILLYFCLKFCVHRQRLMMTPEETLHVTCQMMVIMLLTVVCFL